MIPSNIMLDGGACSDGRGHAMPCEMVVAEFFSVLAHRLCGLSRPVLVLHTYLQGLCCQKIFMLPASRHKAFCAASV